MLRIIFEDLKVVPQVVSVKIIGRRPPPGSAPRTFRPTREYRTTAPGFHFSDSKEESIHNPAWFREFFPEEKLECGYRVEIFPVCKDCVPPCNPGSRSECRSSSATCCPCRGHRSRRWTCWRALSQSEESKSFFSFP